MDDDSLQDVAGLRKELVEAPALGLLHLQDVSQDGHQLVLQPPAARAWRLSEPEPRLVLLE